VVSLTVQAQEKERTIVNDIRKTQQFRIKALRRDATKLETVAKHLRQEAKEIAEEIRREDRAEKARANFYSKRSNVDPGLPLVPREVFNLLGQEK
jgi:septal ring factor EnvC (AmiA/AmiB activator)